MKIGDLVRHVVHSGALGIIVERYSNCPAEAEVLWTNNSWGKRWELTQNIEVINASR